MTIKRRTRKKSHSVWALGQAVMAELHLGRFPNWTGGGPEQPDPTLKAALLQAGHLTWRAPSPSKFPMIVLQSQC